MNDNAHSKINAAFDEYREQLQSAMHHLSMSLSTITNTLAEVLADVEKQSKQDSLKRWRVPVEISTTRIESGYRWCWAENIDEAEEQLRHGDYDEKIVHDQVDYESEETTLDRNKIEEVADTDGPESWA